MRMLILSGVIVWLAAVGLGSMIPSEQVVLASFISWLRSVGLVIIVVGVAVLCMQKKQ